MKLELGAYVQDIVKKDITEKKGRDMYPKMTRIPLTFSLNSENQGDIGSRSFISSSPSP